MIWRKRIVTKVFEPIAVFLFTIPLLFKRLEFAPYSFLFPLGSFVFLVLSLKYHHSGSRGVRYFGAALSLAAAVLSFYVSYTTHEYSFLDLRFR